jgi:phage shock protein PspC (stress-responsive transcriptional regulator)
MKKKLTKSSTDKVITGTLAGIAEYFGIDATIVRIIYVVASVFLIGSPIILYILLALIVPSANSQTTQSYGHNNPYYQANAKQVRKDVTNTTKPKEAAKSSDDDWGDF